MDESSVQRAVESMDPLVAEEAFRKYDIAIQQSSQAAEKARLLLGKAVFYGVFLRFEESRGALELAAAEAPNDPGIQLELDFINAGLYDQEGKAEEAFQHFSEVLSKHYHRLTTEPDLRSTYEDIQLRRAFDAARIGRFKEAIRLLREALSFSLNAGDMSNAFSSLGRCYSELGEYDSARECFLKAAKIGLTTEWEG